MSATSVDIIGDNHLCGSDLHVSRVKVAQMYAKSSKEMSKKCYKTRKIRVSSTSNSQIITSASCLSTMYDRFFPLLQTKSSQMLQVDKTKVEHNIARNCRQDRDRHRYLNYYYHHHHHHNHHHQHRHSHHHHRQQQQQFTSSQDLNECSKTMLQISSRLVSKNHTRFRMLLFVVMLSTCVLLTSLVGGQQADELGAESRGASDSAAIRNSNTNLNSNQRPQLPTNNQLALNQLVNFLNTINNQQQQAQQRRPPAQQTGGLPLATMGNQRAGSPQAVSSTPVNPFAALNFQPTRRQQQQPISNNGLVGPSLQSSSSSTPPTLTLNRIANQFNIPFRPTQQNNNNNPQVQSMNTIPLSSFNQQQQQNNNQRSRINFNSGTQTAPDRQFGASLRPALPGPITTTNGQQFQQHLRSPLMPPPPQFNGPQQPAMMRPISGFAPSGPPPGTATNSAINVVQSPPNAIGTTSPPSSSSPPPTTTTTTSASSIATTTQVYNQNKRPVDETSETNRAASETTISNSVDNSSQLPTTTTATSPTTTSAQPASSSSSSSSVTSSEVNLVASSELIPSTTSTSSTTSQQDQETTQAGAIWNPVNGTQVASKSRSPNLSLAPTPDIVTVPPGYNPDQPPAQQAQSYDISVSAQMGPSLSNNQQQQAPQVNLVKLSTSEEPTIEVTTTLASGQPQQEATITRMTTTAAPIPTETTTIIWSSESSISQTSTSIRPTKTQPTPSMLMTSQPPPTRIRDSSQIGTSQNQDEAPQGDSGDKPTESVVYGKPAAPNAKPAKPGEQQTGGGRPFIQSAPLDAHVRPFTSTSSAQSPALHIKSNHGHSAPFKPSKPLVNGNQMGGSGMSVGSAFTIVANGNQTMPTGDIQDYVAGSPPNDKNNDPATTNTHNGDGPTISAVGGPDPATFDLNSEQSSQRQQQESSIEAQVTSSSSTTSTPRLRRPTFKPKPAVPPIRIDSCIVGDDSSCDQSHNERCVTEYGISSCHCRPGFARLSQLRGYCSPISLLQFNLKIDKLSDDRRLAYNSSLENQNSEEYQYLEFETIQALASAWQQTAMSKQFMGARVNKFYERKGKIWANVSINLEANNLTRNERIQQVAGQELAKLVQLKQARPLGDSAIVLDGSRESISKLVDVNECASKELNDCSKHATCTNEFGGYSCQCLAGFEDKHLQQASAEQSTNSNAKTTSSDTTERSKMGRVCMGCSASYCSNRGECFIQDGKKQCKCRANFMGSRCDIDSEVLAVAIGGSLVGLVILIVTFWCLFVFNRRWRREQQKMDAISATSGLTYNYANSNSANNSTGSLMSPVRATVANPLGGGGGGRSAYAPINQRYGTGYASSRHYSAPDQQAIIGSTSSGSSAASQPIACNPYAASAYHQQYEDAGLLIAPASTGSSEQTSPSGNSYRNIIGPSHTNHAAAMLAAGSAYTLSGHHHHHHHHQQQHGGQHLHHAHANQLHLLHPALTGTANNSHNSKQQLSQFHPAMADYMRTLSAATTASNYQQHCQATNNGYDMRWRTLRQDNANSSKQQLAGYYLVQ